MAIIGLQSATKTYREETQTAGFDAVTVTVTVTEVIEALQP